MGSAQQTVQEATLLHSEPAEFGDASRGDESSLGGEGDAARWMAFHKAPSASVLVTGRILKLFPRVDRRIQGSGLTQWF